MGNSTLYELLCIHSNFYRSSQIVNSILDNQPVELHLSVLSVLVSLSAIPVPHRQSDVASARILGDVVLSKERSG